MVSHTFSALCVYSTFGHHPHLLGYSCAKFHYCHGFHCCVSPCRKIAYSITQSFSTGNSSSLFDAPGTKAFASENIIKPPNIVIGRLRFYDNSIFFCVCYPPSSLNGIQPKPATWSEVSAIIKCMSKIWGIPSR